MLVARWVDSLQERIQDRITNNLTLVIFIGYGAIICVGQWFYAIECLIFLMNNNKNEAIKMSI